VLGTILLGGIAAYVLHAVVFEPIRQMTHFPAKELRISANRDRINVVEDFKLGKRVWNIIPDISVGTVDCAEIKINETFKPYIFSNLSVMLDCIQVVPLGNQGMSFQP
jgi:hypothetical protein